MARSGKRVDVETRLYEKIDVRGPDECWPWKGYTHKGYAIFSIGRRKEHALRIVLEIAGGQIVPPGMEVDHTCSNRLCCNPAHGEIVTHSENMRRAWARGRMEAAKGGTRGKDRGMRYHFADTALFTAFIADPRPWKEKASLYGIAKSTAYIWTKHGVQKRYHR